MIDPASRLITVVGGGGFVGRYVCEALLKAGARLKVACRDPRRAWFLQPLGNVGQVVSVRADVTRPASLAAACAGADAVINLAGILKGNLRKVHVEGAGALAAAARDAGAAALVHLSAIGADPASPSYYGASKGEGEAAVRAAFPQATIIRPSMVFGPEDQITNRLAALARLPVMPVIAARTRVQPVHVADLAAAIAQAALEPERHGGATYEIGGPHVMTMRELAQAVANAAGARPDIVELPDFVASLVARLGFLPGALLTRDQWLMLQRDNVADSALPGLAAFGIAPTALAAAAPGWLGRFRRGGRFARHAAPRPS